MLVVISPAKRLNETATTALPITQPAFQPEAVELADVARNLTAADLQKLMGISEPLAKLNVDRFRAFSETPCLDSTAPAALMFAGDTYLGLEADTLDDDAMRWAQDHLRILSGLYGLLRPLDMIQPYRLEMGSRLATKRGKSLYDYWGNTLSKTLEETAARAKTDTLLNCASVEYFSAVDEKALGLRIVTPVFMEMKPTGPKIVSFFAKKARGAMARYVMENRCAEPEAIKDFDVGGYKYTPDMSEGDRWVFLRDEG
ncbi:peroxide stress protein YaaA [Aliiroseovarius sp. YM-037]|uniref:peroxide stress protein YaaA n=1 Tax=Aliiroseovarius sp. YM-037 TaxID=3341728 RepID=UPI003A80E43B